eukprot:scaffold2021_cov176-Amphora_coffeaeformis.AAC.5
MCAFYFNEDVCCWLDRCEQKVGYILRQVHQRAETREPYPPHEHFLLCEFLVAVISFSARRRSHYARWRRVSVVEDRQQQLRRAFSSSVADTQETSLKRVDSTHTAPLLYGTNRPLFYRKECSVGTNTSYRNVHLRTIDLPYFRKI